MFKIKHGFTLAEMMVVMLILSIIMAAMAPVMTTRNKLDQSSPWQWAENGSDAYYGLGDAQVAMIGQQKAEDIDTNARLIINAGDNKDHILFKTDDDVLGRLKFKDTNINGYLRNYWVSDRRSKYVGKENTSGLEKIKQLKVFNYTFKKDEKKTPHVGVIAQDLQKVFPDAVTKAKDGFLRIRFEDMFFAMINAIKELDSRITALEKENQELKEILKQVQNDNRKLNATLNRIQDDNKKFEARLKALEAKIK